MEGRCRPSHKGIKLPALCLGLSRISHDFQSWDGALKITEYNFNIKIKIPDRLDKLLVSPVLLYRRIRYGFSFRKIVMTQGKFALVDQEDYSRLSQYRWYPQRNRHNIYAYRFDQRVKGQKFKSYPMHRDIMNVPDGLVVDHINGNGLDNRKANLRLGTYAQNSWNRPKARVKCSSKYKGVCMDKKDGKFQAQICVHGSRIYLGRFDTQKEAAIAYDKAAKFFHGEFAKLNLNK